MKLITLANEPHYNRRGILMMNLKGKKSPIYIGEYQTDIPLIAIYGVRTKVVGGKEFYDKDYIETKHKEYKYSSRTTLGALASAAKGNTPTVKIIKEYQAPLFRAKIVEGTDTFTGRRGFGFYEQEPDTVTDEGIEENGKTGVFIGLDSFKWQNVTYSPRKVLDDYRQQEEDEEFGLR